MKNIVNTIAAQCCGSGSAESQRSACHVDYSHICKTPSSYTPNVEYDEGQTCDEIMGKAMYSVFAGKDFSSPFACAGENDQVKLMVERVAAKCCGSGSAESQRSACSIDEEEGGAVSVGHTSSLAVILAVVSPLMLFHLI